MENFVEATTTLSNCVIPTLSLNPSLGGRWMGFPPCQYPPIIHERNVHLEDEQKLLSLLTPDQLQTAVHSTHFDKLSKPQTLKCGVCLE